MTNKPKTMQECITLRRQFARYIDRGAYLPTPEEIQQACGKIQAGWTATEKRAREGKKLELEIAVERIVVGGSQSYYRE